MRVFLWLLKLQLCAENHCRLYLAYYNLLKINMVRWLCGLHISTCTKFHMTKLLDGDEVIYRTPLPGSF